MEKWDGTERRGAPWSGDVDSLDHRVDDIAQKIDQLSEAVGALHTELRAHVAEESPLAPAVQELVTVWRGSKIMLPFVAGAITFIISVGGVFIAAATWLKDHVR